MDSKYIFLVDDDPFFAEVFLQRTEKLGHFNINHYNSAERAIGRLTTFKPEIIFLDHLLGGINGIPAIPLFKEILPTCKIVLISSMYDDSTREMAKELGADLFFQKDDMLMSRVSDFIKGYYLTKQA